MLQVSLQTKSGSLVVSLQEAAITLSSSPYIRVRINTINSYLFQLCQVNKPGSWSRTLVDCRINKTVKMSEILSNSSHKVADK